MAREQPQAESVRPPASSWRLTRKLDRRVRAQDHRRPRGHAVRPRDIKVILEDAKPSGWSQMRYMYGRHAVDVVVRRALRCSRECSDRAAARRLAGSRGLSGGRFVLVCARRAVGTRSSCRAGRAGQAGHHRDREAQERQRRTRDDRRCRVENDRGSDVPRGDRCPGHRHGPVARAGGASRSGPGSRGTARPSTTSSTCWTSQTSDARASRRLLWPASLRARPHRD
jgi:hypothetical protein